MITKDGRQFIRDKLNNNVGWKIGNGGDSTNPNATDLDVPINTLIQSSGITINSSSETTIDYNITVNGASYVGQTIKEIGLYEITGSKLLCRVPIESVGPLVSTDIVEIIITLEVD